MAGAHPATATSQNDTKSQCERVVYARLEKVVKSAKFVLDIPEFDEYLRTIKHRQLSDYGNNYINFSSDFSSDGIMAKIQILERVKGVPSLYTVRYDISLKMDQVCFNLFEITTEAFVCKDRDQIKIRSVKEIDNGNRELSIRGDKLDVSAADILQKVRNGSTGITFRIVLNVKATVYKRPEPHTNIIGVDTQCDPPFLKPIQNGADSDVQLVCEGETFQVHSLVLKNVSLVFRRMLEAPMKEAAMRKIVIEDMNADTTKGMVDYIYKGHVNVGSDAQVVDLLYAAEKYYFDLLKTACLKHMVASMSVDNITNFLHISTRVNAGDEVVEPMVTYCLARIVELLKREEFQTFAEANPMLLLGNLKSK